MALGEGEGDATAAGVGGECGLDHLMGLARGGEIGLWGAVFFDGGEEVRSEELVAFALFVGDGEFGEIGEGFPSFAFRGAAPAWVVEPVDGGDDVVGDVHDAFGAADAEAPASAVAVAAFHGGEVPGDALFEAVEGVDAVAEDGAEGLGGFADVGGGGGQAVVGDVGHAPLGVAEEVDHEVKEMGAEYDEVFGTGAVVFFAACAYLEEAADDAVGGDAFFDSGHVGGDAEVVGDLPFEIFCGGGGDHFVGFREVHTKGFFHEAVRTGLDAGEEVFLVSDRMARADGDEVGFFFQEHFPIVGVGGGCAAFGGHFGASVFVGVGEGGDGDGRLKGEGKVHGVAIAAAGGVADDAGLVFSGFGGACARGPGCRGERACGGEESAAVQIHVVSFRSRGGSRAPGGSVYSSKAAECESADIFMRRTAG